MRPPQRGRPRGPGLVLRTREYQGILGLFRLDRWGWVGRPSASADKKMVGSDHGRVTGECWLDAAPPLWGCAVRTMERGVHRAVRLSPSLYRQLVNAIGLRSACGGTRRLAHCQWPIPTVEVSACVRPSVWRSHGSVRLQAASTERVYAGSLSFFCAGARAARWQGHGVLLLEKDRRSPAMKWTL